MSKGFRKSEDAVTEVVGYSLLLGIIVLAVGLVTILAMPIIDDTKEYSYLKNVEQAFTVLDSKASMVALGKSPTQVIQMYTQAGSIAVDDQTYSNIKVVFLNGTTEYEVYNDSMGTIQYELYDNKIAYEGGGVFRKYPGGGDPVLVTPPEFHYNGETLTMPIIRINSNQSIGGTGVVTLYLVSDNEPDVLFPDPDSNDEYTNPLLVGKQINVVIRSEYYKAWAEYIEERTDATVRTDDDTNEVTVLLNTRPNNQSQELDPPIGVYGFNGVNESALHEVSFILPKDGAAANFDMKYYTSTTEPYFTVEMKKSGGLGVGGVSIFLEYHDGGDTEIWDYTVQALLDAEGNYVIDLLNATAGTVLAPSSDNTWTWANETPPWNQTFTKGDPGPSGQKLIQHYMTLVGPTFLLYPASSPYWDGFVEDESSYILYYEVLPPRITYLHVVEHRIEANVA